MVAIALMSMSASDYNRDAIVICTESVAVWRGANSYTAMNIEAALRDGGPSQGWRFGFLLTPSGHRQESVIKSRNRLAMKSQMAAVEPPCCKKKIDIIMLK